MPVEPGHQAQQQHWVNAEKRPVLQVEQLADEKHPSATRGDPQALAQVIATEQARRRGRQYVSRHNAAG
ncbi:hypothetical protein D3C85_1232820 [compost metagenome]